MKKLVLISTLIIIVVFSVFSQETTNKWMQKAVGLYEGVISGGTGDLPGLTNFYMSIDGTLKGEYEITEGGRTVSGTLTEFKKITSFEVKFKWKDPYGIGNLVITFNEDFSKFTGYWTVKGDDQQYLWNGMK